jgi:uncharacterized protein
VNHRLTRAISAAFVMSASLVFAESANAQTTASCALTGVNAPPAAAVSIGSVQGSTNAVPATGYPYPSPLPTSATSQEPLAWPARYNQTVTVHGVVTAVTSDGSRGFYVQDCGDSDPNSSDAVFVFTGSTSTPVEVVGDVVSVTGRVGVFFGQTQISQSSVAQRVKTGTAPLPAPVEIDVPSNTINPDALLYFERLEGMRVRVSAPRVIGAAFRLPGAAANTTTFYVVDSDDTAELSGTGQLQVRNLGGGSVDYNPEAIEIADDAIVGGGSLTPVVAAGTYPGMPPVTVGDVCQDIDGVLNYSFNSYKVFPTTDPETLCSLKPKPTVGSAAVRARQVGEVSIASFNVENLFPVNTPLSSDPDDQCVASSPDLGPCYSAAELATKVAKLTIGLVDEMKCPDVVMVQETYSENILATELVPRLAARGCPYVVKSFPTHDVRGIENAVLYRTDRSLVVNSIVKMPTQSACGGDPFLTPSPGREPLVATFTSSTGVAFTVIGNHWKSKGGDGPLFGQVQPPVRTSEVQRKCQAQALRQYLDTLPATAKVAIVGDFNDFAFPEPGEGADPLTILQGSGSNALVLAAAPGSYSFNFSGRSQSLDHIYLTPAANLLRTGVATSYLNSDFGDVLKDDQSIGHGASDHNPDVVFVALDAPISQVPLLPGNSGGALGLAALLGAGLFTTIHCARRNSRQ